MTRSRKNAKNLASGPRILCVSPFFPPAQNAEAFCGGKLIRALLEAGLDISVLYCSNINGPNKPTDNSECWESLKRVSTDVVIPADNPRVRSLLGALQYRTHFYVRWIDAAVRAAQQLHEVRRFDLVYSRSLPTVAHLAGFWCSRKLNLPWIVNINDPWDSFLIPGREKETSSIYSAVSNYWFRKTISNADLAIYPSERLHRYHERILNFERPTAIIPHVGYSVHADNDCSKPRSGTTFRLVHTGKLGLNEKPLRPTDALLMGLSEFLEAHPEARTITKLTLVGPEDHDTKALIMRLGLHHTVESLGPVSYEESLRQIASATVCVLVEAVLTEGIFLPSKLVDYISARKPILALSPQVGVVADLAAQGELTNVSAQESGAVRDAISGFYSDFKEETLSRRAPSERLVSQFMPEAVAEQFLTSLDSLNLAHIPRFPGRQPNSLITSRDSGLGEHF